MFFVFFDRTKRTQQVNLLEMNKTCQIKVSVAPDKLSTINNSTILEIKKELCIFSVCLKGCIAQADESSQGQVAVVDKAINLCAVCAYGQGPTINRTLPVFLQFLTSRIEMDYDTSPRGTQSIQAW